MIIALVLDCNTLTSTVGFSWVHNDIMSWPNQALYFTRTRTVNMASWTSTKPANLQRNKYWFQLVFGFQIKANTWIKENILHKPKLRTNCTQSVWGRLNMAICQRTSWEKAWGSVRTEWDTTSLIKNYNNEITKYNIPMTIRIWKTKTRLRCFRSKHRHWTRCEIAIYTDWWQ